MPKKKKKNGYNQGRDNLLTLSITSWSSNRIDKHQGSTSFPLLYFPCVVLI